MSDGKPVQYDEPGRHLKGQPMGIEPNAPSVRAPRSDHGWRRA